MQEAAAEQLYKRNWRYHKDLHLWLTKDVGSEPTQKTATYERGSYIFFDPNVWEKVQKEHVLVFEHLETRVSQFADAYFCPRVIADTLRPCSTAGQEQR